MPGFMLDTNAFNRALDADLDPAALARRGELYVTHIQHNELHATTNIERRQRLMGIFAEVEQVVVPTAAAVWGVSEYGGAEFGNAGGAYNKMLLSLNARNRGRANNSQDILIAVTALTRGYILVTNDRHLSEVLREAGGTALAFEDFLA